MLVIPAGTLSAQGKNALTHPFDSPTRFYGEFVSSAVQAAPHKLESWLPGRKDRASPGAQGPFGGVTPVSDNPVQPRGRPDHSHTLVSGLLRFLRLQPHLEQEALPWALQSF